MRITASEVARLTGGRLVGADTGTDGVSFDSRSLRPGDAFVAIVDTRDGNGAPRGRLGSGSLTVPIAGRGGVPASGATAVLRNVTAVVPSAPTYLTVFSTDVDRPLASNVNAGSGQVVPNMVIARLGPDGAATVFNSAGDIDVVADVMGYFVG